MNRIYKESQPELDLVAMCSPGPMWRNWFYTPEAVPERSQRRQMATDRTPGAVY